MFKERLKLFAVLLAVVLVVVFCCISCTAKKETKAEPSAVDKLLSKAPDNLLGFVAASGADEVKPAFDKTSLGKIWNDPGTQSFYQSIKNEILSKIKAEAGGSEDFNKFEVVRDFAKVVLRRPIIIGAASREDESKIPVYGFAIVDAGQRKEEISSQLEKLEALADEGEIIEVNVGSYMMHRPRENDDVDGYWGWVGDYLVFAINEGEGLAIKYLEDSGDRTALDYLSKVPCSGDGLVMYGDYEKLLSVADVIVQREGGEKDYDRVKAVIGELGLDKIKTVAVRMGFSGSNLVVDKFTKMASMDAGVFSSIKPAEVSMLDMVDGRAMNATAWNFDIAGMYDTIFRVIKAVSPNEAYSEITEGVAKLESEVGFKLRGGLFESFSGQMVFFALPAGVMMEAPGGGPVLIAKLKDKALFKQTMSAVGKFASAKSGGMVQVSSQTQNGRTLNVWAITPLAMMRIMPTWTVVDDYVVIATNTVLCNLTVGQMDSRKNSVRSTAGYKSATAKMPRKPLLVGYTDSKVQFNQMVKGVQQFWPMLTMMASKGGVKLPVMLPSLSHIADEMEPGCYYAWSDSEGYYSHYHGAGIEQSIGTVAGGSMAMAIMMPALARTRQLALRTLSATHLSGIGKGCLMYASDHNEKYPESLEELVKEGLLDPKSLISKYKPKGSTEPSYVYITGQNAIVPGNNIIAYDNPAFCVKGVNVLFNDGHVQWMKKEEFLKELEATHKRLGREMPEVKFKASGKFRMAR